MIDIYALDDIEEYGADEERLLSAYIESLINGFIDSPESQSLPTQDEDIGFWIRMFIEYGFMYEGYAPPTLTVDDAAEIMEDLLPRKVALSQPEEADEGLAELIAFWEYLGREHELSNANAILTYLRSLSDGRFRKFLFDPARAGMAKSMMMGGHEAGFDMSTEEGINEYIQLQSAMQMLALESPESSRTRPSTTAKQKNRKKMAKASRRTNRKPKKKKKKRK